MVVFSIPCPKNQRSNHAILKASTFASVNEATEDESARDIWRMKIVVFLFCIHSILEKYDGAFVITVNVIKYKKGKKSHRTGQ